MDENEEKEYNDIASLAAYLHSDKMQAFKAAEERAEKGLPPLEDEPEQDSFSKDVLFTSDRRRPASAPRRRPSAKHSAAAAPVSEPVPKTQRIDEPKTQRIDEPKTQRIDEQKTQRIDEQKAVEAPPKPDEHANSEHNRYTDRPRKKHSAAAKTEKHESADAQNIPALSESLSESLGLRAAEINEQNRNALPPEDTPEIFDITEGSDQEKQFNNAATRLMNAVNDPVSRNDAMREDMEAEEEEIRAEKMEAAIMRRRYERQKQSTRTLAYILIALLLCTAIIGASAYASAHIVKWALDFTGIAAQDFKIDVEIPEDASVETVAAILAENNIISDAKFFKLYADFADKLKADEKDRNTDFIGGKYTVSSTMSYSTLLSLFRTEKTRKETVSVRIIEGMNAREIGDLLEKNNVCYAEDFEKYYKDILNIYDFERRVKQSSSKMYQLEGYLFPDTYEFYVVNGMADGGAPERGETEQEARERIKKDSEENALVAAKKMYSNFNDKMTMKMYKKMGEMNMTLDEVVALASIVQKEAGYTEDMEMVASVFLNRIRHSAEFPYLQSDVTIMYVEDVIKPNFKGSETAKTRLCNAYNTYVCQGIPAGPVCNPGLDAINAVLYSAESPYFYFCANPDTGEIFYAETEEKHNENKILAGLTGTGQTAEEYGEGENG
ncbi:MAG: endolytic transglycosylase MltG [Ruminiclostridium sp.]|nr:endolytic transglycosylase MltG [Ruminiclostridium sp.]